MIGESRQLLMKYWNIRVPEELRQQNVYSNSPIPAYLKYIAMYSMDNSPIPVNILRSAGVENTDTIRNPPRYLAYTVFCYANKEYWPVGVYYDFSGETYTDVVNKAKHEWEWYLFNYMATQGGSEWALKQIKLWVPGMVKRLELE